MPFPLQIESSEEIHHALLDFWTFSEILNVDENGRADYHYIIRWVEKVNS
jgi:hypothetical protein